MSKLRAVDIVGSNGMMQLCDVRRWARNPGPSSHQYINVNEKFYGYFCMSLIVGGDIGSPGKLDEQRTLGRLLNAKKSGVIIIINRSAHLVGTYRRCHVFVSLLVSTASVFLPVGKVGLRSSPYYYYLKRSRHGRVVRSLLTNQ